MFSFFERENVTSECNLESLGKILQDTDHIANLVIVLVKVIIECESLNCT